MPAIPLGIWGIILLISVWINLFVLMLFTYKNLHIIEHHFSDCQGVINTRNFWEVALAGVRDARGEVTPYVPR